MRILALDLGKFKTVACDYDEKSGKHEFETIKTNGQEIHDLVLEREPDRVVFEVGPAAGWIYDLVVSMGIEVQVANVNHEGWRWKNTKRKNDRLDALRLAQLSAMNQLPMVHISKRQVRQQRALIMYRQTLVKRCTQIKNSIRAILDREGLKLPPGKKGWTGKQLEELHQMSVPMIKAGINDLWRGLLRVELEALSAMKTYLYEVETKLNRLAKKNKQIILLQSAAGVGPRLAEAVVAFIDDPHRFKSGKQVGSYAGLTPRQYQSGSMDRQGRISGQGNKFLRSLLVEVSWMSLRWNPWAKQTYERICRGSASRKKIAITAVARKLLVRCWAMLRDEEVWQTKHPPRLESAEHSKKEDVRIFSPPNTVATVGG